MVSPLMVTPLMAAALMVTHLMVTPLDGHTPDGHTPDGHTPEGHTVTPLLITPLIVRGRFGFVVERAVWDLGGRRFRIVGTGAVWDCLRQPTNTPTADKCRCEITQERSNRTKRTMTS